MIHITICKSANDLHMGFRAHGHAGMAESGQDIVCAAASVLMINTINAIEEYTEDPFSGSENEVDGSIEFMLESEPTQEANLLLKALVLGLRTMQEDYEEYINLSFEEV